MLFLNMLYNRGKLCACITKCAIALSLYTNRLDYNKLSQAKRTHPDIGLLKEAVTRCQQTCCKWCVFGCVAERYFDVRNNGKLRLFFVAK